MTNYVTANDCANLLLAVGASPVMADDPMESAEITAGCDALTLSLGTPSARRLEAMRLSIRAAKEKGIPVILDPVGVTLSQARRDAARELLDMGAVGVIRANASEIRALAVSLILVRAASAPVLGYLNGCYFTVLSGGDTAVTFFLDSGYVWGVNVVLAFLLSSFTSLPFVVVYFICVFSDVGTAVIGTVLVKRGKWAKTLKSSPSEA